MLSLLALLACDPAAVTLDEDLRQARPGQADTDDSGLTDDSGDTGDDSGDDSGDSGDPDTDDSGTNGDRRVDDDRDGYCEGVETDGVPACGDGSLPGDCDDNDYTVFPGADEVWYDGIDQDCDGYSDYDQDGDESEDPEDCVDGTCGESWLVLATDGDDATNGTDCDDDDDGYYAYYIDEDGVVVDCLGNHNRPDCDDRYPNVNPEVHEDNNDWLDNNCNEVVDGLGLSIEWSLTLECVDTNCSERDYVGTMTVTISDDFPDLLVLLGGGSINTAESIDLADSILTTDVYEIDVVAGETPDSGDGTTSFGDQAATVSYLYVSEREAANGSRCVVWGPRADVLATYHESTYECVDITDLVGVVEPNQYWDGWYE